MLLPADKAGGDVQPESGRAEYDDVSLSVSSLQAEARSSATTEDQPRAC